MIILAVPVVTLGCSQSDLYTGLPEKEVNEMMAILSEHDIGCGKVVGDEGTWNLTVEPEAFSDAVNILSELGRPREKFPTMEELFPKTGFVSSPAEQRIRLTYGLEQSLSKTISELPGVVTARVHLVLPENDPFSESAQPSSASVVVIHRRDGSLENSIPLIKQIVLGAVAGLDPDGVSVELVESDDSLAPIRTRRRNGASETRYTSILSMKVAKESANLFLIILSLAAIALIVAVQQIASSLWRRRRSDAAS